MSDVSTSPVARASDEKEVVRLQQIVREKRKVLDATEVDTPAHRSALEAVLLATVELVNFEAEIPVRRREIYSARTAEIVRRIGLVGGAGVAVVALLALTPWLSSWWLLLLVPLLLCAGGILVTAGGAAPSDRPDRREFAGVWVGAVAIALTTVLVSGWLSVWVTGVLVFIATTASLFTTWVLASSDDPAKSDTDKAES